nr:MAG TPA: hypothetical protein [Caudoviricetes sp.]
MLQHKKVRWPLPAGTGGCATKHRQLAWNRLPLL